MQISRFGSALVAMAMGWSLSFSTAAQQPYPAKPIRLILPQTAGTGVDVVLRKAFESIQPRIGQPFIVDYHPGSNQMAGAELCSRAAPDGYTICALSVDPLALNPHIFAKLPYDPMRDFTPIAMFAHVPGVLVAHPSFPAKTVGEIIKMAKAKPGAMMHGASSIGSSSHMNIALLKYMAGIDMLQVAYPGDTPALVALLGGHVPFAFNHVVAALPHLQSGKLRAIAVATAQRIPQLPDAPTVAESGLPGYEGLLYYSLMGPAKMPPALIHQLHEAVKQVKQTAAVKQRLISMGAVSFDMTQAEIAPFLQVELDKWTKVIKAVGIKPE